MPGLDRTYADDPSILDEDELWRRVPPDKAIMDGNLGRCRPSSQAFRDKEGGQLLSVDLARVILGSGGGPEVSLAGHKGYFLASITAGLARTCEPRQRVAPDPLPHNPAHAVVFGKKTKGVKKRLARGAAWVVQPARL